MLYSRTWQYAMRILLHLARLGPGEQARARALADEIDVPPSYASKILSSLTAADLVRSRRGPQGGVMLSRSARTISFGEVATAVGEDDLSHGCVLGFRECSDEAPCPVHPIWKGLREGLRDELLNRSLADFAGLAAGEMPETVTPPPGPPAAEPAPGSGRPDLADELL